MPAKGERVQLLSCSDPYTRLTPGSFGTVALVDGVGTVHVDWDDGHSLGLIPGQDSWRIVSEREEELRKENA